MKKNKTKQLGLDGEMGRSRFRRTVAAEEVGRVPGPGQMLVEWLNKHRHSEDVKRISELIWKIKKLQYLKAEANARLPTFLKNAMPRRREARRERVGTLWDRDEFYWAEHDGIMARFRSNPEFIERLRLELQINRELDNYSFLPRLHVSPATVTVAWIPPSQRQSDPAWNKLALLLSLAEQGQLDSIGSCEKCGRWFRSGRRGFQKFCGSKCQQSHYKSSPEWKARRAQYMRRYRKTGGRLTDSNL